MQTQAEVEATVSEWFSAHLPDGLFTGAVDVTVDREEITVVGPIPAPPPPAPQTPAPATPAPAPPAAGATGTEGAADATAATHEATRRRAAAARAVKQFRESTRQERVAVARDAEQLFGRKVSWGVECDGHRAMFTTFSVPVMTRLRQSERQVLDTLVDAGVARSRSDAVAWCVRLVGRHTEDWLGELRAAVEHVERARGSGPE